MASGGSAGSRTLLAISVNTVRILSGWRDTLHGYWPGLLLAAVIAVASAFVAEHRGGPTLLYALLLGMALNTVAVEGRAKAGVDFAARRVLRLGVALLGARITVAQIAALGWEGGGLIVAAVAVTIGFGAVMARVLGMSRRIGILTGGATAICGASAAIAIAAVLPRDERSERELIFTIAGVTLLSTAAMIAYPVIANMLGLDAHATGLFLGATIHDVAQVVGAGYSISPEVGDAAVLTKLLRVTLLLPVVLAISLVVRHRLQGARQRNGDLPLPGFLLAFVALVVAGSLGLIPDRVGAALNEVARACLVVAIAAVGLKTSPLEMKKVGATAVVMLGAETAFLAVFVLVVQRML
jgi:uncharacterized integral membrane protein (TIGR00698 family)